MNADELREELQVSAFSFKTIETHMLHDNWERLLEFWAKMPDDIFPTLQRQKEYYFLLAYDQLLYLDIATDLTRPFAHQIQQTSVLSILKVRIIELQIIHLLLIGETVMMTGGHTNLFLLSGCLFNLRKHLHEGMINYIKDVKNPRARRPPYPLKPFQTWSQKELGIYAMQSIDYLADIYRSEIDVLMTSNTTTKEFNHQFMKLTTMLTKYLNICVIQNQ
jgi:hypothetical protein